MLSSQGVTSFDIDQEDRIATSALAESTHTIETYVNAAREVVHSTQERIERQKWLDQKPQALTQTQQLSKLINVLQSDTHDAHLTSTAQLSKTVTSTLITIDDTLSRHDHNFEQVEDALYRNDTRLEDAGRDHKLLAALQHTQSQIIRTRLDRKYLETITSASDSTLDTIGNQLHNDSALQHKIDLVKTDLRTLHSEIDDVSQMVVAHEHGDQLLACSQRLDRALDILHQHQEQTALNKIEEMTSQLESITEHAEMLQSQRLVVARLGEYLNQASETPSTQHKAGVSDLTCAPSIRDTAALAALRQYLGISVGSLQQTQRSQQINAAFDEFIESVNDTLDVQRQQHDYFRGDYAEGEDGHVEGEHQQKLDELDTQIAEIKAKLEASQT